MAQSDLVLNDGWVDVIRNMRLQTEKNAEADIRLMPNWAILHLGGGGGNNSDGDLKMHDEQGNNRLHISTTETETFDSDISAVAEQGFFELGGRNAAGQLQLSNPQGTGIEMVAGTNGRVDIEGDDDGTYINGADVFTGYLSTDRFSTDEAVARNTHAETITLGGGELGEQPVSGSLTATNDSGDTTVQIDGQGGTIQLTGGSGAVSSLSDARVKRDVDRLDDAVETITALEGVTYEWTDAVSETDDDRHVGFLAQEVAETLPDAVTEHDDGRLGVTDDAFTPVLVEAIKEQQEQIEQHRERIDEQADRIAEQREEIDEQDERIEQHRETIAEQRAELDAQAARIDDQRDRIERLEDRLDRLD